jgi:uncharacterized membrane protein
MSDVSGTPSGPYGQPADGTPYRATHAISYGWQKFKARPSTLLVPMIVVLVVLIAADLLIQFVIVGGLFGQESCDTAVNAAGQPTVDCGQSFWRQLLGAGLGAALISLVAQIMLAGIYRGALRVIDGEGFSLGQLFEGYSKTQVVFAAIFIAVATGIATVLCFLPGVLIAFLTSFTLFFIVDQQLEAAEAIAASVKMVWHNFWAVLVFGILAVICLVIGTIALLVGLLVAVPVVVFGAAYTYRRLEGLPVSA